MFKLFRGNLCPFMAASRANHFSCKILQPGSFALHRQSDLTQRCFSQRPPTWFTAVWLYFLNAKGLHSVELGPRLNTFKVCVPCLGLQFNWIHLLYWVQSQLGKSLAKIPAKLHLTCAPCAQFSVYVEAGGAVSVQGGVGWKVRWRRRYGDRSQNFIMWVLKG